MIETILLFITIFISLYLLRIINGSFSLCYLNGLNYIFYRQVVISALIGSYVISLSMEYPRWYALDWEASIRLYGLMFVCYSSVSILLTYAILKYIFISQKISDYNLMNVAFTKEKINIEFIQMVLFFMSSFGFFYIVINSSSWPMLDAIMGNSNDALLGRISFRTDFKGSDFIKNLIAFSGSSLYFYISLSRRLIRSDGFYHFIISMVLVVLIYTYNSQKGAILNVAIGAVIIFCMIKGKISVRTFLVLTVVCLVSILLLFSVVKGIPISSFIDSGGRLIIGRLFLGNIEGFFNSLVLFPDFITESTIFVGVPSIIQAAFLGEAQEPSKLLLMKYFDLDGVQNGTSGFITSYFMAEAWANYNVIGIVFAPVLVAINFFIVDFIVYKHGKNIITITFYAIMYLQFQLHGEFIGFLYFKYFIYFFVSIIPVAFIYLTLKSTQVLRYR